MHSGVGRIRDGNRNARKNNSPKITYRIRLPEDRANNTVIARIEAYPEIKVVSGIVGKTERLNGNSTLPANWIMAGILRIMDIVMP